MAKNKILIFIYLAQLGFILGNSPFTFLMIMCLTMEFAGIVVVFTYYKIRQDGHYLNHLLNLPGASMFVVLFFVIAFAVGMGSGEIPESRNWARDIISLLREHRAPIALTFSGVILGLFLEVHQMKKLQRVDFLEREFIVQTFSVAGVVFIGLFSIGFTFLDPRIPIITMGAGRLAMEIYSTKRHLQLKRKISAELKKLRSGKGMEV